MACCKVCCGCAICEEGDQGKCCCGTGSSAVCCAEGEYCCDGVCQAEPCECDENNPCTKVWFHVQNLAGEGCGPNRYFDNQADAEADAASRPGGCTIFIEPDQDFCCGGTCCPPMNQCCNGVCQEEPCGIWCCEVDEDNNPTGNCFPSEAEGQDCAQGVTYDSEAACLDGCEAPP